MARKNNAIWSLAELQNTPIEEEWGKKETIYASESEACPCGIYHALLGAKAEPTDPQGIRRMQVGSYIEDSLVTGLKARGIFLEAQERIFDEQYKVSGRPDAILISPDYCTAKAKKIINRRKEIFRELELNKKNFFKGLDEFRSGLIAKEKFTEGRNILNEMNDKLYDEDFLLSKELMEPDTRNSYMLLEIKSINDMKYNGFKMGLEKIKAEGKPMTHHEKQIMFYYWKLREKYPNLLARIEYVGATYQEIVEIDVQFDEAIMEELKNFWSYIWKCVDEKTPPVAAPTLVQSPGSRNWKINFAADICKYHTLCTGNLGWKEDAKAEVWKRNHPDGWKDSDKRYRSAKKTDNKRTVKI